MSIIYSVVHGIVPIQVSTMKSLPNAATKAFMFWTWGSQIGDCVDEASLVAQWPLNAPVVYGISAEPGVLGFEFTK